MSRYAEMLRLVGTVQAFIDTNPNDVKSLADSALLIEALIRISTGRTRRTPTEASTSG